MTVNMMEMTIEALIDEQVAPAILTAKDVKEIKYMLKYKPEKGLAIKLAQQFNCTPMTISNINTGANWKHIKVDEEF